jgi:hypothetical protein
VGPFEAAFLRVVDTFIFLPAGAGFGARTDFGFLTDFDPPDPGFAAVLRFVLMHYLPVAYQRQPVTLV